MPSPRVALDLAAFLDSSQARALALPRRDDLRRVAEAFYAAAYEDLGKAPRLLDGDDLSAVLGEHLPARLQPKEPAAEHLPAVLAALLEHIQETQVVSHVFELRRALDAGAEPLVELVRSGANASRQVVTDAEPFVHRAGRTGRNDPCPCGSGKKYKKCHGKGA